MRYDFKHEENGLGGGGYSTAPLGDDVDHQPNPFAEFSEAALRESAVVVRSHVDARVERQLHKGDTVARRTRQISWRTPWGSRTCSSTCVHRTLSKLSLRKPNRAPSQTTSWWPVAP